MASYIGRVGEFSKDAETFTAYVERMEMFFTANNVVETPGSENVTANQRIVQQRKAIFLTEVGAEVYSVLSNLLSPAKPKDSTLENIIRRLKDHYDPAPLEITESFHFGMRNQNPGESINDYIVALKKLSIHCNYGEFLNRALRDRFVCGLNSAKIHNKLLNTSGLTFGTRCQIAISMELADKNSREFSRPHSGVGPEATSSVNKLSASENNRQRRAKCSRCNGYNHSPKSCKFKDATCYRCQEVGHIAVVCKKWVQGKPVRGGRIQHLDADFVDGDAVDNEGLDAELGIFGLYATSSKGSKGYHVEVEINGENMDMQIDTAADYSIMSRDTYVKKFKSVPLQKTDIKLKTYTGETLKTCGQIACKVVHAGQEHTPPMIVAENEGKPTLLGRNWLDKLKLDWNEVFSLAGAISANEELDRILEKHADLFREGYDGMKGLEAHIRVRENAVQFISSHARYLMLLKKPWKQSLTSWRKTESSSKSNRVIGLAQ